MSEEIQNKIILMEKEELKKWKKENSPPIPLSLALSMYELYLNGYGCEDIWRANGQRYPLGQIVDAKIRYDWDKRKEIQLASLYGNIENKVLRVKNEAISHLSDLLAAAHKIWGDKVRLFLQDGDITVLGSFDPSSIKNYKELLSMLTALTNVNKDSTKEVKVDGTVNHVHTVTENKKKLTGTVASDLLKIIEEAEIVNVK